MYAGFSLKKTLTVSLSIDVRITMIRGVVYLLRIFKMFHGFWISRYSLFSRYKLFIFLQPGGSLSFKKRNITYFLTGAHWTTIPASHINLSENFRKINNNKVESIFGKKGRGLIPAVIRHFRERLCTKTIMSVKLIHFTWRLKPRTFSVRSMSVNHPAAFLHILKNLLLHNLQFFKK